MSRALSITTSSTVASADWHREDIKAAVRKRGSTLSQLSRDAGLCTDAGHITLDRQWVKMERAIADFLGVEPWEIWPTRYTAERAPIGRRSLHATSEARATRGPGPKKAAQS